MIDFRKTAIGIELGSTRIKAVLIDEKGRVLSQGSYAWENQFINNFWTYPVEDIHRGLQTCFLNLKNNFQNQYGKKLITTGSIGISAMMHGYMVFDENDQLLVPFRTWRNINAESASKRLTNLFEYRVPARWSISHLYQAILEQEAHVKKIKFQTTLEGYIHYLLTGHKVIGIGEASGMFPIDTKTNNYDTKSLKIFNSILADNGYEFTLEQIFPRVLVAGEDAGKLTEKGALFLDPSGEFQAGVMLCPPEGDAQTGMVATNAIKPNTGNISAGTSIFGMIVLEENLKTVYPEIDLVTTPIGDMVAMVHCNNCTSEINAWVSMVDEILKLFGTQINQDEIYEKLFKCSVEGKNNCDDIMVVNYLSGESITQIENGRPLVTRKTKSQLRLREFMRSQIYSCFATLKLGFEILFNEGVRLDKIAAHGGIFKTEGVAQKYLAAALDTSVSVMKTAGEGGAWGMALLALFAQKGGNLIEFLDSCIFKGREERIEKPDVEIKRGFDEYMENYKKVLIAEAVLSEKF
ncbi:MAG: xylulokinase [Bacilli bacterium]|jgi:sugar (pentulose or hexulose) kinase